MIRSTIERAPKVIVASIVGGVAGAVSGAASEIITPSEGEALRKEVALLRAEVNRLKKQRSYAVSVAVGLLVALGYKLL